MLSSAALIALLAGSAIASPVSFFKREIAAPVHDVTIHESCNSTERRMLQQALADTYEVATIAKEYTVNNGPADPVFLQYFGNAHDAYVKVLGVWESILTGNKDGVLFRCDNIDGNCANAGWRGHWRGENGTSETVICPLSYTDRKFNPEFCMEGFYLPTGTRAQYWSIDLIHRLLHVPQISGGAVGHFSDDYETALELAHHNSSYAAIDSDALQYFAAHVYGQEVAQGGEACVGPTNPHGTEAQEVSHDAGHGAAAPAASSAAAPAASSAAAPASTAATATSAAAAAPPATTAGSAPKECHTHADGVEHCV